MIKVISNRQSQIIEDYRSFNLFHSLLLILKWHDDASDLVQKIKSKNLTKKIETRLIIK
jgi:hypothetical protein